MQCKGFCAIAEVAAMTKGKLGVADSGHAIIVVTRDTKARLNKSRAPGQCYGGFVRQPIGCWGKRGERVGEYLR